MNRSARAVVFSAAVLLLAVAGRARAARFVAVPSAETVPAGRYSVWQFGVYEKKSTKTWRTMNRLDLGAGGGVELGVFAVSPKNQQPDAWLNAQWQPLPETDARPALSVGVWDLLRKAPLFSSRAVGPSPFVAAGKTFKRGVRSVKVGVTLGANRLDGVSGGIDARVLKDTGAVLEFAPKNLRLRGADAWDAGVYQWFGPHARARVTRTGGNLMLDALFAWQFGGV